MFKIQRLLTVFIISCLFLVSCSDYQKLLKTPDIEKKYEGAVKYYNEKDYVRALPLLEELVTAFKATKRAEKVYYYFAYTHYGLGDYTMASYHFDNFTKSYPNSEFTEECQFMSAYCYYLDSPGPSLDQTSTYKAISELQVFIDKYPASARVVKCNELIDQLRFKLEEKSFETAKLYYNMEYYKAAITSFNNVVKDFPNTKHLEECMFLSIKAYYQFAKNSIEEKKPERYKSAVDAYLPFVEKFPKGKYSREAESIFTDSKKQLEKLKTQNS